MANISEEKKKKLSIQKLESVASDINDTITNLHNLRSVLFTMIESRFYHTAMVKMIDGIISELEVQKRTVNDSIVTIEKEFNQIQKIAEVTNHGKGL